MWQRLSLVSESELCGPVSRRHFQHGLGADAADDHIAGEEGAVGEDAALRLHALERGGAVRRQLAHVVRDKPDASHIGHNGSASASVAGDKDYRSLEREIV